jgi:hypothetical protein
LVYEALIGQRYLPDYPTITGSGKLGCARTSHALRDNFVIDLGKKQEGLKIALEEGYMVMTAR